MALDTTASNYQVAEAFRQPVEDFYARVARDRVGNVVRLPFNVDNEELLLLNEVYSPKVFLPDASALPRHHPVAATGLWLAQDWLDARRRDRIAVDIGASFRTIADVEHSCYRFDAKDEQRVLVAKHAPTTTAANRELCHKIHHGIPDNRYCTKGFGECCFQADVALANHVYDIPFDELAKGFYRHGVEIGYFAMFTPDELTYDCEGWNDRYQYGIKIFRRKSVMPDGTKAKEDMAMMYFDDPNHVYIHSLKVWRSWCEKTCVTTRYGNLVIERFASAGPVTLLYVTKSTRAGSFTSVVPSLHSRRVKVLCLHKKIESITRAARSLIPGTLLRRLAKDMEVVFVDADVHAKLTAYGWVRDDNCWHRTQMGAYVRAVSQKITIGLAEVQKGMRLSDEQFNGLATSLFLEVCIQRQASTKTIGGIISILKSDGVNFLTGLWNTVVELLSDEKEFDFLPCRGARELAALIKFKHVELEMRGDQVHDKAKTSPLVPVAREFLGFTKRDGNCVQQSISILEHGYDTDRRFRPGPANMEEVTNAYPEFVSRLLFERGHCRPKLHTDFFCKHGKAFQPTSNEKGTFPIPFYEEAYDIWETEYYADYQDNYPKTAWKLKHLEDLLKGSVYYMAAAPGKDLMLEGILETKRDNKERKVVVNVRSADVDLGDLSRMYKNADEIIYNCNVCCPDCVDCIPCQKVEAAGIYNLNKKILRDRTFYIDVGSDGTTDDICIAQSLTIENFRKRREPFIIKLQRYFEIMARPTLGKQRYLNALKGLHLFQIKSPNANEAYVTNIEYTADLQNIDRYVVKAGGMPFTGEYDGEPGEHATAPPDTDTSEDSDDDDSVSVVSHASDSTDSSTSSSTSVDSESEVGSIHESTISIDEEESISSEIENVENIVESEEDCAEEPTAPDVVEPAVEPNPVLEVEQPPDEPEDVPKEVLDNIYRCYVVGDKQPSCGRHLGLTPKPWMFDDLICNKQIIHFASFIKDYKELSNFAPVIIHTPGLDFPHLEGAYQFWKTDGQQYNICSQEEAVEVKKANRGIRACCTAHKVLLMAHLVDLKFNEPTFQKKLVATGFAILKEWTKDPFWGADGGNNALGMLLIRKRYSVMPKLVTIKGDLVVLEETERVAQAVGKKVTKPSGLAASLRNAYTTSMALRRGYTMDGNIVNLWCFDHGGKWDASDTDDERINRAYVALMDYAKTTTRKLYLPDEIGCGIGGGDKEKWHRMLLSVQVQTGMEIILVEYVPAEPPLEVYSTTLLCDVLSLKFHGNTNARNKYHLAMTDGMDIKSVVNFTALHLGLRIAVVGDQNFACGSGPVVQVGYVEGKFVDAAYPVSYEGVAVKRMRPADVFAANDVEYGYVPDRDGIFPHLGGIIKALMKFCSGMVDLAVGTCGAKTIMRIEAVNQIIAQSCFEKGLLVRFGDPPLADCPACRLLRFYPSPDKRFNDNEIIGVAPPVVDPTMQTTRLQVSDRTVRQYFAALLLELQGGGVYEEINNNATSVINHLLRRDDLSIDKDLTGFTGAPGSGKTTVACKQFDRRKVYVIAPFRRLVDEYRTQKFEASTHIKAIDLEEREEILIDEVFALSPGVFCALVLTNKKINVIGDPYQMANVDERGYYKGVTVAKMFDYKKLAYLDRSFTVPQDVTTWLNEGYYKDRPFTSYSKVINSVQFGYSGPPKGHDVYCYTTRVSEQRHFRTIAGTQGMRVKDMHLFIEANASALMKSVVEQTIVAVSRHSRKLFIYLSVPSLKGLINIKRLEPPEHICLYGGTSYVHSTITSAIKEVRFSDDCTTQNLGLTGKKAVIHERICRARGTESVRVLARAIEGVERGLEAGVPIEAAASMDAAGIRVVDTVIPDGYVGTGPEHLSFLDEYEGTFQHFGPIPKPCDIDAILDRVAPSESTTDSLHYGFDHYAFEPNRSRIELTCDTKNNTQDLGTENPMYVRKLPMKLRGRPCSARNRSQLVHCMLRRYAGKVNNMGRKEARAKGGELFEGFRRLCKPEAPPLINIDLLSICLAEQLHCVKEKADKEQALDYDLAMHAATSKIGAFLKTQTKKDLAPNSFKKAHSYDVKAGQGISQQPKVVNLLVGALVRACEKLLRAHLLPEVLLGYGLDPKVLSAILKSKHVPRGVPGYETDVSEFDSQRGLWTDIFMDMVYEMFGVCHKRMSYMVELNRKWTLDAGSTKLSVEEHFQSGRADTLFSNTCVSMAFFGSYFDWDKLYLGLFQGDDVAVVGEKVRLVTEKKFLKPVQTNLPTFCSYFVCDGLVIDAVAMAVKLGNRNFVDQSDLESYRLGVHDWLRTVDSMEERNKVISCSKMKYNVSEVETEDILRFLHAFSRGEICQSINSSSLEKVLTFPIPITGLVKPVEFVSKNNRADSL